MPGYIYIYNYMYNISIDYRLWPSHTHWASSNNVPARSENFMKRDEYGLERAILSFTSTQHRLK